MGLHLGALSSNTATETSHIHSTLGRAPSWKVQRRLSSFRGVETGKAFSLAFGGRSWHYVGALGAWRLARCMANLETNFPCGYVFIQYFSLLSPAMVHGRPFMGGRLYRCGAPLNSTQIFMSLL
jgi:hypothetical protein